MPIDLICDYCGDEYSVIPSRANDSSFCSMNCKSNYQSENFTGSSNPNWSGGHMVSVSCKCCRDVFECREDKKRIFCSSECFGSWCSDNMRGEENPSWKGGKEVLICQWCGTDYKIKPVRVDDSRFCSHSCLSDWMANDLTGSDHPNWDGGVEEYYGGRWKNKRERILNRDGECRYCGMTIEEHIEKYGRRPDVHHIIPFKEFDNPEEANDEDNLMTLCIPCHHRIEP